MVTEPVSLALARHIRWIENLPPGWHDLFCQVAERLALEHPRVRITHAGQKLAMLQILTTAGDSNTHALITQAWQASARTCEECGAGGRPLMDDSGWCRTLCPAHAGGFRVPPRRDR